MKASRKKVVVMIPTYNERDNIQGLIQEILRLPVEADISVLVVDDDSPDGTTELVFGMAEKDSRVHILVRTEKRGRGAAGIAGFKKALDFHPDLVLEMDGDFSHQPRFIPALLSACQTHDVAIGSRFIKGGKDVDRHILRRLITLLVRIYIRRQFRLNVRDVSSGFRCFRREVLERINLDDLVSIGPSIVLEVLYKTQLLGFSTAEVPIVFIDRKKGETKLTFPTLLETLTTSMKFKKMYAPSKPKGR